MFVVLVVWCFCDCLFLLLVYLCLLFWVACALDFTCLGGRLAALGGWWCWWSGFAGLWFSISCGLWVVRC